MSLLFSPSCPLYLVLFLRVSFPSLSAALLAPASFIFHFLRRPYHSLQVARIISPVEYHIRPRLRAPLVVPNGILSRCIIIGAKGRFRIYRRRCSATREFAREQRARFFTWVFQLAVRFVIAFDALSANSNFIYYILEAISPRFHGAHNEIFFYSKREITVWIRYRLTCEFRCFSIHIRGPSE